MRIGATGTQHGLFDAAEQLEGERAAREHLSIDERFIAFHAANPRVYRLIVMFARQLRDRGYPYAGIGHVVERVRWEIMLTEIMLTTTDPSNPRGFKINNDYRSRYARLVMHQEPDLRDFFRTRVLPSRGQ